MTKTDAVALTGESPGALLKAAKNHTDRLAAARVAQTLVRLPGYTLDVPAMVLDFPPGDDNDAVVEQILLNLAASEDIERASSGDGPGELDSIVDLSCTITDVRVRPSDIPDSWGFYLTLAVRLDGEDFEAVYNTGAKQVAVVLWRCVVEDRIPVHGRFVYLGSVRQGRSRPLSFQVEATF